jgi:uncharacterized membrane protein
MMAAIRFELAAAWLMILPLAVVASLAIGRERRRGLSGKRIVLLGGLRLLALLPLVFLAARPTWIVKEPPAAADRSVLLLMDRSESMSLEDAGESRYRQALEFLRERLLPGLKAAGLPVKAMLFDQQAEAADGATMGAVVPTGRRTNLAGAIAQACGEAGQRPLAIIALTDGAANETEDNGRALAALAAARAPFIGVGFGNDRGMQTLSLQELDAPTTVAPKTAFSLSARIELMNAEEAPSFDLLLFQDGQLRQKRSVTPGRASRTWLENFILAEDKPGPHNYSVRLVPPGLPGLKCVNRVAGTTVNVSDEKELRVLYIQGALTWDYKFISLALRKDSTMKLTGLTRTSSQSVFRQNVESEGELLGGFPVSLEELAPFRVVVLSNLRASDLSPVQQEVLAKFCGEMGGGLLMIGGEATFDRSWQNSRLEQLLPVVFSDNPGAPGAERPFRMQPTEEALQHPVFQIADGRSARDLWAQLPTFTQFGRVDAAKPGAQVWAQHQTEEGPQGRRILMASQRFGAGLSAVLCIQNFWRWRLAREAQTQQFDRFWRQLFRFLGEAGRQEVAIHLADQDLAPQRDIKVVLERQPNPRNVTDVARKFLVKVENSNRLVLREERLELAALHPVELKFRAEKPDIYTVTVSDAYKMPLTSRPIEIRDSNVELMQTARDMETLRQWAAISDGLAMKAEDCRDAGDLVGRIKERIEQVRQGIQTRRPIGANAWVLAMVLGCLGGEWALRKRWGLI